MGEGEERQRESRSMNGCPFFCYCLFFDAMQCRFGLQVAHSSSHPTYQTYVLKSRSASPLPSSSWALGASIPVFPTRPKGSRHHQPSTTTRPYLALEIQTPMMATGGHLRVYNVVCRDGGGAEATCCCIDVFASQSLHPSASQLCIPNSLPLLQMPLPSFDPDFFTSSRTNPLHPSRRTDQQP